MIKSCYIHIPFCKSICSYCDFCKNYYNEKIVGKYLLALENEIKHNYKGEVLDTLYIGGGTPSALSLNDLRELFNVLSIFKLNDNYEFTFECNYEDITKELLILLKENKVNRLSIGIQTFNNKYASILNRRINKKEMIDKINLAKSYFDNINLDLMYALPNQTIKDLEENLKIFIKLNVNHISTYSLILEEHTKLWLKNINEIDEDIQSNMYYKIVSHLKENGYNHYELSNFFKDDFESKHNLTYWNNEEYYGFGAGASGFINNIRYDNTKSVYNYINGNIRMNEEKLNKEQLLKDEVMLSLRKITGINKISFKNKYNISLEDVFNYKDMIINKLLIEENNYVYIPEDKLYVSNEIIIRLIDSYILNKENN